MKFLSIALLCFALGVAGVFISDKNLFMVENIKVVIDSELGADDYFLVESSVNKKLLPIKGKSLWGFGLRKTTEDIVSDPKIQSVELSRRIPNTISVKITPEVPQFYFSSNGKIDYAITKNGKIISLKSAKKTYIDLPVLKGEIFRKNIEIRQRAVTWFNDLPDDGILSRNNISEVEHLKNKGFLVYLNQRPEKILLGKKGLNSKTLRVERVLRYLVTKEVDAKLIDARYREKVVVKLHEAP